MNIIRWFVKREPVILGAILAGVGVFLGIRYGAHVNGAGQIFPGVSVASFVAFLSRFVGPSAVSDVQGIANDVKSLEQQLAPLRHLNGWQSAVAWLHGNGKQIVAIVEAAKTDVEDLLHLKAKDGTPPAAPPATVPQPTAPHVPTHDAFADLAKLVPPIEPPAAVPAVAPAAAPPTPGT